MRQSVHGSRAMPVIFVVKMVGSKLSVKRTTRCVARYQLKFDI